jgi:energy-coupling factor transporter transmembrane protein EcfT
MKIPKDILTLPCEEHIKLLNEALKAIESLKEEISRIKKAQLGRK